MLNQTQIGDCRDIMRAWIAQGVKVRTCVTSPPYWGLRDYGVAGQIGLEATVVEYVETMVEVFRLVRGLLADDGTLWLNLGDSYAGAPGGFQGKNGERASRTFTARIDLKKSGDGLKPKDLVMVPARVALALQTEGWWLRQDIIWHKLNPMPESVTDRCTKAHEYLFLLSKSERYYFDAAAISEEAIGPAGGNIVPTKSAGQDLMRTRNGLHAAQARAREKGGFERRNRRSVWTIASEPYSEAHFATFPTALVELCILAGSEAGDLVLDPFMGSGTVGQVSQNLGRRWIGCELNPEYVKLERKRTAQGALGI